jgi:hypothetical protein
MIAILKLFGFKVLVTSLTKAARRTPKYESIRDSYSDLTCYGIIAQLMLDDKWGK